jgi:hypothetical protein
VTVSPALHAILLGGGRSPGAAFNCDRHPGDLVALFIDRTDHEPLIMVSILRQFGGNDSGLKACRLRAGQDSPFFIL